MLTLKSNPYFICEGPLQLFVDEAGKQLFLDGYEGVSGILMRKKNGLQFELKDDTICVNYSNHCYPIGKVSNVSEAQKWVEAANKIIN